MIQARADNLLLDTSVLLHWLRGKGQARVLDDRYQLSQRHFRPLICEVSLGELLAFSRNPQWSEKQHKAFLNVRKHVVSVDISEDRVMEAYADVSTLAKRNNWPIFHGKNDLWIAASAFVSQAHLLTMDKGFLPLCREPGWRVTVLDIRTVEVIQSSEKGGLG